MFVGNFLASTTTTLQIERRSQVLQFLASGLSKANVESLLGSTALVEVWNNKGKLIPPIALRDLLVLNGDEYSIQMSYQQATGANSSTYTIICTFELCDEGSLEKTIYVKFTNPIAKAVGLSAIDVRQQTAVRLRNYNFMNVVSPVSLPKNSICIMPRSGVLTLQKNHDVMSDSEILTHSNSILRDGCLEEIHPVLYDAKLTTPALVPNAVYQSIAENYAMGYGSLNSNIVIVTGEDDFVLYPNSSCSVAYCQKELTKIAQQVADSLAVAGQTNNVDNNEFASAVAVVGNLAEKQNVGTDQTQFIANKVINQIPSVKIGKKLGITNLNLSVGANKAGISKLVA